MPWQGMGEIHFIYYKAERLFFKRTSLNAIFPFLKVKHLRKMSIKTHVSYKGTWKKGGAVNSGGRRRNYLVTIYYKLLL